MYTNTSVSSLRDAIGIRARYYYIMRDEGLLLWCDDIVRVSAAWDGEEE